MNNDLGKFIEDFDIVENALDMRNLTRWNGRDLREKENLSEHTHLVIACLFKLYRKITSLNEHLSDDIRLEKVIERAMLHDSLELLRGDILSITKNAIAGLRDAVDKEETLFMNSVTDYELTNLETKFLRLADLMACYKFVEREIKYPSNDFALNAYLQTKADYDVEWQEFCYIFDVPDEEIKKSNDVILPTFQKGYADDAGIDVTLTQRTIFLPQHTQTIPLRVKITPRENEMAYLLARTSAANKGLIVAQCPIDPNYTGDVLAIVHNISNEIVVYEAGEAFCQVVCVPFNNGNIEKDVTIRKAGKRSTGNLGSTGGVK